MIYSTRNVIGSHLIRSAQKRYLLGSLRTMVSPAVRRYKKKQTALNAPSLEMAKAMPRGFDAMDNSTLISVAASENHEARIEVLKRHIMAVDNASYEKATETFHAIAAKNREGMFMAALPYNIGIISAVVAAFGSMPMVFHRGTAEWFNEGYVTTDVPEEADLETWLEVGSWTWNWMEPPLGALSFSLLCLQFSRAQMQNLGIKPYTSWLKEKRAQKLAADFPRYDPVIIQRFSETDPMVILPGTH